MAGLGQQLGWTLVLLLMLAEHEGEAFNCKFSNEGCDQDAECCSFKCVQSHPGTNARCTRCSLHERCLYTHHCEERLVCGANHTCCAKFWGTCTRREDCCNQNSLCREMDGFFYKRCVERPPSSSATGRQRTPVLVLVGVMGAVSVGLQVDRTNCDMFS